MSKQSFVHRSRCLELCLDNSPEQTRRIQDAQRRACEGRLSKTVDVALWQDAQRVLQRRDVVIPFATKLSFPARTTADRRGNMKLLGLVKAHALLHQRQRRRDRQDRVVAEPTDYAAVFDLLQPTLARGFDGLPPRAARAYELLAERDAPLTRREIASALGWNYMTAARALEDLGTQELVQAVGAGVPRRYRALVPASTLGSAATLTPPAELT